MKHLFNLQLIVIISFLAGCSSDDSTGTEAHLAMLTANSWANPTVTNNPDGDLSEQYDDFAITFSKNASGEFDGTFLLVNGGIAFPESTGKWKFSDDFNQIIFDSGRSFDITLTNNLLQLEFTIVPEGGRLTGLSGHFIFELHPL